MQTPRACALVACLAMLSTPVAAETSAATQPAPLPGTLSETLSENGGHAGPFVEADSISWKVNEHNTSRWKTLIGGMEGGQVDDADIQFGVWQLAPNAIYHGHRHDAPEIYHITGGRALWIVDGKSQEVSAGSTIYTRPGQVHRMENLTDQPVSAIWVWWAPGGDRSVFSGEYTFTEPAPEQPEDARFSGDENDRLY